MSLSPMHGGLGARRSVSLRRRIALRPRLVEVGLGHLGRLAGGQTPAVADAAWAARVAGPFEKPLLGFTAGSSPPTSSPRVGLLLGVPTDAADPGPEADCVIPKYP